MTNKISPHNKRTIIGLRAKQKIAEDLGIFHSGTKGVYPKQLSEIETIFNWQRKGHSEFGSAAAISEKYDIETDFFHIPKIPAQAVLYEVAGALDAYNESRAD